MGFLDKIFGGVKPASPEPKATPKKPDMDQVAEIPANDGYSIIVLGRDSTMGINDEPCFVRRYPLLLKLPEGMTPDEFVQKHGGDKRSVQPDGTIAMKEIPGEAMIAADWLEHFTEDMKKYGIELPAQAIYDAMGDDMGKQGPKYLQPVSQVEALAHNKKEGRSPA
jgi:hypothetical protein